MASSSGDEFESYQQSPRVDMPGSSKHTMRPVAGPSKPPKRKKAGVLNNRADDANANAVETISISSDEDDRLTNGRRRRAATGAAPNGRTLASKGKGKVMALKPKRFIEENQVDVVEETTAETEEDGARPKVTSVLGPGSGKGNNRDRQRQQIERLQKQLEEVAQQRDNMSAQLEELFQLRHSEPENLLVEQKVQYDAQIKARDDTIRELQLATSGVDGQPKSGETTSLHFLTREAADEEKQDVQREVIRLKDAIKRKDDVIVEKENKIKDLDDTIKVLRADLKTEIENTKTLTSRNPSSASKHPTKLGDTKNALAIRLYEELTDLLITNVRHEPGKYKEDDAIYTCVQTTQSGTSINFTLRFVKEPEDVETSTSAIQTERLVDKVIYTPLSLGGESAEFITQLDFLAGPFTFQKEQMSVFTKTLLTYLEGGIEDNPNADPMEAEDD